MRAVNYSELRQNLKANRKRLEEAIENINAKSNLERHSLSE